MFITEKDRLIPYYTKNRVWQGIPGLERTRNGRLFSAFYSGGITEQLGNFVALLMSDDDGISWSEPIAVAYEGEDHRAYDECLWIDPLGRLWLFWAVMPDHRVMAVVCDNPDSDKPIWSEPRYIGEDVMMCKPTVASDGSWLLPIAVWAENICVLPQHKTPHSPKLAYAYRSRDNGATFERLGGVDMPSRCFDEHMIVERRDGSLAMYVRTFGGIGISVSRDGGLNWEAGVDSGLGGPCSRFFIRRLNSGRLLLINHKNFTGRNNLTAMLSDDDGFTWSDGLLLDGRTGVSYPDGTQDGNGYIYLTYDRDRVGEAEILLAVFNEDDILAGKPVSPKCRLAQTITKLR